jgi:YVTN family beta-propeller protein
LDNRRLKAAGCAKPYDVRVDKRGAHAYVSCSGNNKLAAIDIVAQMVEYIIETGSSPRDLQLFGDDQRLLVANSGEDTVSIVDITNRRVLYKVPVSLQPYGVAVTDNGKTALVTGWASGDLHI